MKMKTLLFVFLYISLGRCDLEETANKKRQVVGGVSKVSTFDPTIVELARSSVALLDGRSNHSTKYKILEITSATRQVVKGLLYKMNVRIVPSSCAKTDIKPAHECEPLLGPKHEICDISVLDPPQPQGRETTINCGNEKEERFRSKRQVVGGVSNVSTSDPTIVDLARSSVALLDGRSDKRTKYKITAITSATRQIVAGILYKINVRIVPSNCAKTDSKPAHECEPLLGPKHKSCGISILDPPSQPHGRETTIKCENEKEEKFRSKRQVVGGVSNVSTSDPTIVDLARSSVALLDGRSDKRTKYKITAITSATRQIVAGILYKINVRIVPSNCAKTDSKPAHECEPLLGPKHKSCGISILDPPSQPHGRETTIKCENEKEEKFRSKRQVVGGVSNVSTSDPTIVDLARSSVALLDGRSDKRTKYKITAITSATRQIVAGILYKINVRIVPSNCAKTDSKPAHECEPLLGPKHKSCGISILDPPSQPHGRETTIKCENEKEEKFRSKRNTFVGGVSDVSTSDPTIVDLARSSLVLLDGTSDQSNKYKVLKITSATRQIVEGTLYKIDVLIAPSGCAKTDSKPAHECDSLFGAQPKSCEISIWDRPWLPQGRETTFKCGSDEEQTIRSKRSTALVDGVLLASPTDRIVEDKE